jgi:hypothetical protein
MGTSVSRSILGNGISFNSLACIKRASRCQYRALVSGSDIRGTYGREDTVVNFKFSFEGHDEDRRRILGVDKAMTAVRREWQLERECIVTLWILYIYMFGIVCVIL